MLSKDRQTFALSRFICISMLLLALSMGHAFAVEATRGATLLWAGTPTNSLLGVARQPIIAAPNKPFIARTRPQTGLFQQNGGALIWGSPQTSRRKQTSVSDHAIRHLIAAPPEDFFELDALGCIAVSIYHEARNQPPAGQYAVGSVILTRAANPDRWGDTACAVVQPVQFSYLTADRQFEPILEPEAWRMSVLIAAEVLRDGPAPSLKGADHYHATYVSPDWNQAMVPIGRIADHLFWRSLPTQDVR